MQFDYNYLCQGLGHLTGLETRVYKDEELIEHYSHYDFTPDIAGLIFHEIQSKTGNAYYIETDDLLLFGITHVKKDNITLIIGPTAQIRPGKQETVESPISVCPCYRNTFQTWYLTHLKISWKSSALSIMP